MDHITLDSIRLNVNMSSTRASRTRRLLTDIKKRSIRSRLLSKLFGEQNEVVIILPSRSIREVTFTREDEPEGVKRK